MDLHNITLRRRIGFFARSSQNYIKSARASILRMRAHRDDPPEKGMRASSGGSIFFIFLSFSPAMSNVIKAFATNVATGAPLSPHLSKVHYGKIDRTFLFIFH